MKEHLNKRRRSTLIGGFHALTLATCAPMILGRSAHARSALKASVYIGTTPHFGNFIVGVEKGFFEAAGLQVTLTKFANGAVAANAFRANDQGIVASGDLAAVRMWQKEAVGICSVANYTTLSVVIARKGLSSASDLKGKKVGVMLGSTSEYFAHLYFARAGMTLDEIEIINLKPAEMAAALVKSDIDAAVVWQPFGWRVEEATSGNVRVISNADGYFRERIIASTSPSFAQSHAAELHAFVRGLAEASRWCINNREQAAQVVSRSLNISDTTVVSRMMGAIDWWPAPSSELEADVLKIAAFLKVPVDWSRQFDSRFTKDLPGAPA